MKKPWENNKGYDDFLTDVFDAFDEDIISIEEIGNLEIDDEEIWGYYEEGYTHDEVAEILISE